MRKVMQVDLEPTLSEKTKWNFFVNIPGADYSFVFGGFRRGEEGG